MARAKQHTSHKQERLFSIGVASTAVPTAAAAASYVEGEKTCPCSLITHRLATNGSDGRNKEARSAKPVLCTTAAVVRIERIPIYVAQEETQLYVVTKTR